MRGCEAILVPSSQANIGGGYTQHARLQALGTFHNGAEGSTRRPWSGVAVAVASVMEEYDGLGRMIYIDAVQCVQLGLEVGLCDRLGGRGRRGGRRRHLWNIKRHAAAR